MQFNFPKTKFVATVTWAEQVAKIIEEAVEVGGAGTMEHEADEIVDVMIAIETLWRKFPMQMGQAAKRVDAKNAARGYYAPPPKLSECYEEIGAAIGAIVNQKQAAYGDSFSKAGDVLALMYPNGVKPEQYTDMLAIVRVLDKLFRVATDRDAFGESPWKDVSGYGMLGAKRHEEAKAECDDTSPGQQGEFDNQPA